MKKFTADFETATWLEDETYVCIPEKPDSEYEFLRKTQFWTTKKLIEQIEKDASDYSGFFRF